MKFTIYTDAKAFSDDVLQVLGLHEIQNNLLYKNIGDGKFMASVKDDRGNVLLTAARTPALPMTMYETDNIRNDGAVAFFARSLVEHGVDADFIMTEKALAKSFCDQYGKLTGREFYNNESLVFYVLDKVNAFTPCPGVFREACPDDMFFLPYWFADFAPACNIGAYDLTAGIEGAGKAVENRRAFIWEDVHPVSLAMHTRSVADCAIIGQVYTPPNLRGRGYSTACVWHLTRKLLEEGFKHCALYADCANPYSNKVYQKVGYKETFWYDQYKVI